MSVAQTILSQLGGNKFVVMTGSKNFTSDGNSLFMKLSRNKLKASHLKITLNSMDTYDMEFIKVSNPTMRNNYTGSKKTVKEYNNVYCDSLQEIFTEATGLYTSL